MARPSVPTSIVIPGLAPIVRHALPTVLECNVVPVVIFLSMLHAAGPAAAIAAAFGWTVLTLLRRRWTTGVVPGLLVLSTIALTIRSVLALATGSLMVYFLQPTAGTALVGLAFVVSVPLGRPLAERLALDICPFDDETRAHPVLRAFLAKVSLLWGAASALNFAVTLWLLMSRSTTTFLLLKSILGPGITVVFSALAIVWFRRTMARHGVQVLWTSAIPA